MTSLRGIDFSSQVAVSGEGGCGVMLGHSDAQIRLIIVEQEGLYRDLLESVLSRQPGLSVTGAFADGRSAARALKRLEPDVAVLDMELANRNGIQLALELRRLRPDLGVVILSNGRDIEFLGALPGNFLFGWCYLVDKSIQDANILGRAVQLIAGMIMGRRAQQLGNADPGGRLTIRQMEILRLVAQGLSNAAVANKLELKEKTVENQLAFIYEKLNIERERSLCHPRVRAVLWYLSQHNAASRSLTV